MNVHLNVRILFVVFLYSFLILSSFIHLLLPSFLSSHSLLTNFRVWFFNHLIIFFLSSVLSVSLPNCLAHIVHSPIYLCYNDSS